MEQTEIEIDKLTDRLIGWKWTETFFSSFNVNSSLRRKQEKRTQKMWLQYERDKRHLWTVCCGLQCGLYWGQRLQLYLCTTDSASWVHLIKIWVTLTAVFATVPLYYWICKLGTPATYRPVPVKQEVGGTSNRRREGWGGKGGGGWRVTSSDSWRSC